MISERTIAVNIVPVVANARVEVHTGVNPDTWISGMTDSDGYVKFDHVSAFLGDSDIRITASGYRPYLQHVTWHHLPQDSHLPQPLNHQVTVGVDLPPLQREGPSKLRAEGYFFLDATDEQVFLKGSTDFLLLKRIYDGADVSAVLAQRQQAGVNTLHVFGSLHSYERFHPQDYGDAFYSGLRPAADLIARSGFYLYLTVFADSEAVMPNRADQFRHWARVWDELADVENVLGNLTNEVRHAGNNIDPFAFNKPTSVLCSRGSDLGDGIPPNPPWDFLDHHNSRQREWVTHGTDVFFFQHLGFGGPWPVLPMIYGEPIGADPVNQPGRRSNVPADFEAFGRISRASGTAGVFLHSTAGLTSSPWTETEYACAVALLKGFNWTPESG